jgi:hypothetical protein
VRKIAISTALLLSATVGVANADMVLTVDDPSTSGIDVIIADGFGAGHITASGLTTTHADTFATAGAIVFAGPVGTWSITINTGISKPALGPPPEMHMSSDAVSTGAGALIVGLTDDFFAAIPGGPPWAMSNMLGGALGVAGTIKSDYTADEGNMEFGVGSIGINTVGPFAGAGAFAGSGSASGVLSAPFSMTNWVTMTHLTAGGSSFDSIVRIPAPAAVILGVLGLGLVSRVRRHFA